MAAKLPVAVIQEDPKLLMWWDQAVTRVGSRRRPQPQAGSLSGNQYWLTVVGNWSRLVRVISLKGLRACWERHPASEEWLRAWFREVEAERWAMPHDVKQRYAPASILGNGRVVFNVGANKYRVVARIRYDLGRVYVRFAGTHAEYDRIDAETI